MILKSVIQASKHCSWATIARTQLSAHFHIKRGQNSATVSTRGDINIRYTISSGISALIVCIFLIQWLLHKFKFKIFFDGNGKVHRTSALASLKAFKIVFVPFAASIVKQFTGSILWVEVVPENNKGKTYIFYLGTSQRSKSLFWARMNQTLLGLEVCVMFRA